MEDNVILPAVHDHPVVDDDPHFIINPDTREISHASPEKLVLIQGDHMSERFTFEIPKIVDGHDMLLCNDVQIHFINVNGSNGVECSADVYGAADFKPKAESDDMLTFSWLISQAATLFAGTLSFAVRFICRDENNQVQYVWNTAPFSSVTVSSGIDNGEAVIENEQYNNILEIWYNNLIIAGNTSLEAIAAAKDKAIEDTKKALDEHAETAAYEYMERVKETAPADVLNVHNVLVQERGGNPGKIMSQKSVDDALNEIESEIETKSTETVNELRSICNDHLDNISDALDKLGCENVPYTSFEASGSSQQLRRFNIITGVADDNDHSKLVGLTGGEYAYLVQNWTPDSDGYCRILFRVKAKKNNESDYKTYTGEFDIDNIIRNASEETYFGDRNVYLEQKKSFTFKLEAVSDYIMENTSADQKKITNIVACATVNDEEGEAYIDFTSLNGYVNGDKFDIDYSTFECVIEAYEEVEVYKYLGPDYRSVILNPIAIVDIRKTKTTGLIDTYTISLSNGTAKTFQVQNGVSIVSVRMSERGDYEDTYIVELSNGKSWTFKVPNGGSVGVKKTVTGEGVVSMSDVSPIEHAVKAKVKSKNLIKPVYVEPTESSGVTITPNEDGSVILNGTTTDRAVCRIINCHITPFILEAGTYTFSVGAAIPSNCYAVVEKYDDAGLTWIAQVLKLDSGVSSASFTLDHASNVAAYLAINSGTVIDNFTIKPQLELGTTATEYTPYVEPTLTRVYARGKNLIPFPYNCLQETVAINGITATPLEDGGILINGTAAGNTYITISNEVPIDKSILPTTSHGLISNRYKNIVACAHDANNSDAYIYVLSGTVCDNVIFYPQIEAGTVSTEYEKGTVYVVSTPNHDGTVPTIDSIAPNMTIFTDTHGVTIEAEYNKDILATLQELSDIDARFEEIEKNISKFEYANYGLPIVYFNGDVSTMNKDTKVTLNYAYGDKTGTCTLKWQGSSSLAYPKKNYTVEFDNAFEAATGWGTQTKYCLKADWIDFSHCRNVGTAKLWGEMVKSRASSDLTTKLSTLVNGGAIDGFPCFVVINGEWQGIYNFNIPKEGWMLGMGDGDKEAILCADQGNNSNFNGEITLNDGFELEYNSDTFTESDIQTSFNNLIDAVLNSDGSDIDTTVAQYLDIDSAIDYYILVAALKGTDMVTKNAIFATYDGVKWFMSAYDLDATWGLNWDGLKFLEAAGDAFTISAFYRLTGAHKLFALLYKYKKPEIIARYKQLRENILSPSHVANCFYNYAKNIPLSARKAENELWTTMPSTSANNVEQISQWYSERVKSVDAEIEEMDAKFEQVATEGLAYVEHGHSTFGKQLEITGIGTATDTELVIPRWIDDAPVFKIGQAAFKDNKNIISAVIPEGIRTLPYSLFYNATNLESVVIPDTVSTLSLSNFNSTGIKQLEIPNGVTIIPSYFAYMCKNLDSVNMGNRIVEIQDAAFAGCVSLTNVRLSNNLKTIGKQAFYNTNISNITLPDSLRTLSDSCLGRTLKLERITIPRSVKTIGKAFSQCWKLAEIVFEGTPDSIAEEALFEVGSQVEGGAHIYVPWAEGEVAGAPWSATTATIHYGQTT